MTQDDNISDIIDIDPESVIENKPVEEKAPSDSLKSRLSRYGLIGVLLLGVAVLGGWFYRAALSNLLPSDQIQAMSQRVDALEAANKISIKKLEAVVGLTDEIKSQLQNYIAIGISHFMLWYMDAPDIDGMQLFVEQVAPVFKSSQH